MFATRWLTKLYALDRSERRLLIRAAVTVTAVRAALVVMPFDRMRRRWTLPTGDRRGDELAPRPAAANIAWAVAAGSRIVPGGRNCLVRAFATRALLSRYGYPSVVRIGAAKMEAGQFRAHAWLESDGNVLIGDLELSEYLPLRGPNSAGI
ncbi:MAG: lasso peptide biosynthesis B2 protein [Candidatus Binataceae bacterium]